MRHCPSCAAWSAGRRGFSIVELLLVISILGLLASLTMPALSRAREAGRRVVCQSQLKQWGSALQMYANESRGELWPPLQARAFGAQSVADSFSLNPAINSIHPDYLSDLRLLSCPSDIDSLAVESLRSEALVVLRERPWLAGRSYGYLGWVIDKANRPLVSLDSFSGLSLLTLLLGQRLSNPTSGVNAQLAAGLDAKLRAYAFPGLAPDWLQRSFDLDIVGVRRHPLTGETLGNGSGDTIYRLRDGIERFLITDVNNPAAASTASSKIWVMFDQSESGGELIRANHQPGGSNVLYMDGHVMYIPYMHGPYDSDLGAWTDGEGTPPVMPSLVQTLGAIGAAR